MTQRAQECFYCDVPLGQRREMDHAPIPGNARGTEVVASCIPCHHLKDRMNAGDWPLPAYVMACRDLAGRGLADADFSRWPGCWDDMSREARLLWAKIAREVARGMPNPLAA